MIIGITGTIGAGKGTIVEYLVKKKGFKHFSVRDFLTEEIIKRNLPVNRDSMVLVGNDLRKEFGAGYIAESLFKRAKETKKNSIIESLRNPMEVEALKKSGTFCLLAVDADPLLRYSRIQARASETDKITPEEFIAQEKREMTSTDPTKQNIQKVMSMADFTIINNDSFNKLYERVEKTIAKIQTKK